MSAFHICGWRATLFSEAGFVGDKVVVTGAKGYVGALLDGRTSSIIVVPVLQPSTPDHPPVKEVAGATA